MVQFLSEPAPHTRQVKLIILDRDGVINYDREQFIKSPDEWRPIPGSLEAIARLNHAGFPRRRRDQSIGPRSAAARHRDADLDPRQAAQGAWPGWRPHRRGVFLPAHRRRQLRLPQAQARDARRHRSALRRRADRRALRRRFACATCRRRQHAAPSRSWCSPAKARRRCATATFPRTRSSFRILPLPPRHSWPGIEGGASDVGAALAPVRAVPARGHADLRDARPAAFWLPPLPRFKFITGWCWLNLAASALDLRHPPSGHRRGEHSAARASRIS